MMRLPTPVPEIPVTGEQKQWTTRMLLQWMLQHLESKGVDSPRLTAEMLMAHVLRCERMHLYMEVDRLASPDELKQLRELLRRAAEHEPVQYLVGESWFYSRAFLVNPTTLIPRPSTESLVDVVIEHVNGLSSAGNSSLATRIKILDLGTGSGCIAITLALNLPHASLIATDIIPDALALARQNALRHGVADRIEFREGNLFNPVSGDSFDVICSNPPYVSDEEWDAVDRNVREYEPSSALRAGVDGMEVIRPLLKQAAERLHPGGLLAVEIAHAHRDAASTMVRENKRWTEPIVRRDHEEYWRILTTHRL